MLSFDDERLTCVESLNRPADHIAARRLLAGERRPTPREVAAPGFTLKGFAAGAAPHAPPTRESS